MDTQMFSWLNFETSFYVIFNYYDPSHQYTDKKIGKWVLSGPHKYRVPITDVYFFREINDKDLHDSVSTDSHFPEKCCAMEYYDKTEKKTAVKFVVGTVKENEKEFDNVYKKYQDAMKGIEKITNDIHARYDNEIKAITNKVNFE